MSENHTASHSTLSLLEWGLLLVLVFFGDNLPPFRTFMVILHETGHALMAIATGGTILSMGIESNGTGFTLTRGGDMLAILSGGYLGSLIIGLLMLAGRRFIPQWTLLLLGIGTLYFSIQNLDSLNLWWGVGTGVLLMGLGVFQPYGTQHVIRLLGLCSVLYPIMDLSRDLLGGARSDATQLAERTEIPALGWGIGWLLLGIGLVAIFRKFLLRMEVEVPT